MFLSRKRLSLPSALDALPGRPDPIMTAETHCTTGNPLKPPFPQGFESVFDPAKIFYEVLLKTFWESHDPSARAMMRGLNTGPSSWSETRLK
jgi:peptide-methionine (S)-S-oxide reductase